MSRRAAEVESSTIAAFFYVIASIAPIAEPISPPSITGDSAYPIDEPENGCQRRDGETTQDNRRCRQGRENDDEGTGGKEQGDG